MYKKENHSPFEPEISLPNIYPKVQNIDFQNSTSKWGEKETSFGMHNWAHFFCIHLKKHWSEYGHC